MEPPSRAHSPAATSATGDKSFEDDQSNYGFRQHLGLPGKAGGRNRSPGLQWHKEYDENTMMMPRVFMIDYVRKNPGERAGTRKVIAQELHDLESLRAVYRNHGRDEHATLRVFHVQNCFWATKFLCRKFHLQDNDKLVGLPGFADWVFQKKPQRRAGKPLSVGKTWKTTMDPWRGIAKCAFGMDYLKHYSCDDLTTPEDKETKVLGLMGYDYDDNPIHRYNVYSQRMSVYVQFTSPDLSHPDPELISPYHGRKVGDTPLEKMYDNGNTIIIFDNSDTGSIYDTLITARGEWESKWRRLPFYLTNDHPETDEHMTLDCMKIITQDIFKSVVFCWDALLDASWEHVSILEEKIYEQPADESRAPELWKNSAHWLKYEKLMFYHIDCVNDMRKALVDIDGDPSDEGQWLKESPPDFERLSILIEEDLVKRTNNLSELMYKSVGIRDSRQSLQLGSSMWRLSWVTFIFLPLTFISGFFGMNVDTFENNPSIAWYFISVVPFMALVLIFWYLLKHKFASNRQTPFQRGVYEALFTELHNQRPDIWSRQGPREYIVPASFSSQIKWRLISRWMSGRTIARVTNEYADEPIGAWNRVKRYLVRRWTDQIQIVQTPDTYAEMGLVTSPSEDSPSPVQMPTPHVSPDGAVAEAISETMEMAGLVSGTIVSEAASRTLINGIDGHSEGRNSGVLVEERREGSVEEAGKEEQERVAETLAVPEERREEERGRRRNSMEH